jgi:ankyrin repeat protein
MEHSAIRNAIHSNKIELVKLFLDNGANPDRVIGGQSLLCLALATSTAAFELLSKRCQNVNIRCNTDFENRINCTFGCTLLRAAYYNNIKALDTLLDKHADVNPEDLQDAYGSPLIAAVDGRELDCVRFLISRGAKVNGQLRTGRFGTPLAAAASMGELDIARILIDNGAEVNDSIPFGRYANVLAAAILGPGPSLQMVKFLVEEKQFDLKALPFVQPRTKQKRDDRRLRGDQVEIVRYFIREYGMDAES